MIQMRYPAEEINPGNDLTLPEKKREGESLKEERGAPENEDDAFPCYASRAEILDALEEAYRKDSELQIKLLSYTLKIIRKRFRSDCLPEGLTSEDVVQIVMEKIISGKRKWNKKKLPNIIHLVLMSIISFIRNEWKKMKIQNNKVKLEYIYQYDEDGDMNDKNLQDFIKAYTTEDLKNEEFKNRVEELMQKCFKELEDKNDVDGYYVFEQIIESSFSPGSQDLNIKIAENLGIPVKDVEKAKKRIKRVVRKIRL